MVAVGEAADVAGVADDHGGANGANANDVDDGRLRRGNGVGEPLVRLLQLVVDAAQVADMLERELSSGGLRRRLRLVGLEERLGVINLDFLG